MSVREEGSRRSYRDAHLIKKERKKKEEKKLKNYSRKQSRYSGELGFKLETHLT